MPTLNIRVYEPGLEDRLKHQTEADQPDFTKISAPVMSVVFLIPIFAFDRPAAHPG